MANLLSWAGQEAKNLGLGAYHAVAQPASYFAHTDIVNPTRQLVAQATNNPVANRNAVQDQNKLLNPRQFLGNTAQLALLAAGGPTSKFIGKAVPKFLPNIVGKTITNAATGAVLGPAFNVAGMATNNQLNRHNVLPAIKQGAEFGAAFGAGGTLAPHVVSGAVKGGKYIADNARPQMDPQLLAQRNKYVVGYAEAKAKGNQSLANYHAGKINQIDKLASMQAQAGFVKVPGARNEPSPALPNNSPKNTMTPVKGTVKSAGQGALNAESYAKTFGVSKAQAVKDVAQIEASAKAPPLTSIPKQAGTVEKVPFGMRPRPTKNPMTPGPLDGTVGKFAPVSDTAQAHLNADYVAKHLQKVGDVADKAVSSLSGRDQDLMKEIQTKGVTEVSAKADNPQAFKAAEKTLRDYYDTRIAYDHAQGIATPYRKNYLRDLIPSPEQDAKFNVTGGNKTPGYTQAKLNPGQTGVLEGLRRDIAGSSFNHAKLTYAQGLEEAFPGQVNRGSPVVGSEGVTQQLQTPYGNELFATKDLAKDINKRAVAPKAEGVLGKYDSLNAVAKYVKLGGGAFHALTESGNFVGQQLASGKLFREPSATGKVFKTFFSDKALKTETARMSQSGALDNAQRAGLTWTPEAIKADISTSPHGKLATYTGIKALHDATFKREIPYMKLKTFEQRTQGLDHNNAEDLSKMRSIAKGVNAEFGGINRAVEGVSPQSAKRWSRILLASDFTESKITTMKNAISKGGEEGKLAREVVAGKALLFGGLAAGGAVIGGELSGNNSNKISTLAGKILDPSFNFGSYKVSLPATHISEFIKPFKSFGPGSTDKFSGLKHYATGRLAAIPSEINQLVNNQDYRGQKIYGGTKTKPISGSKAALNIASTAVPIPGSQGISAATGQQSIPSAVANVVGLRSYQPTPTNAQKSAQKVAQTGNQATAAVKANPPHGYSLQKTSDGKYAYTLDDGTVHTSSSLQTAQQDIAKDSFSKQGISFKTVGDTVYRKAADGSVSTESKTKFDYQIGTATLTAQKNAGDVQGWLTTANSQLDSINKQLKDPNIDPLDALTLQNDASTLQDNIAKYSGYGGFTKPTNSVAKSSFKTASASKAPKLPSIKVAKARSFKAPKTNKLSVSKIPSNYLTKRLA